MKKFLTSILLILISITLVGCSENIQSPVVLVENVAATKNSITFEVNVTDTDLVGSITSLELYQGTTLIESLTDLAIREFTGLLSNTAYTVQVTYTYDLDDDAGEQTSVVTYDESTLAKDVPVVLVENVSATQDSITFEVNVTDTDLVGSITSLELYQGDTLVESLTDLTVREFTGLLSNTAYTAKATYIYDLDDDAGEQTSVVTYNESTLAKDVPVVLVENVSATQDSITFEVEVTDPDSTLNMENFYYELMINDAIYLSESISIQSNYAILCNLTIGDIYNLKYVFYYDLNDGTGLQTIEIQKDGIYGYSAIKDIDDFLAIGLNIDTLNGNYYLTNNIDFNNQGITPIGSLFLNGFTGNLEGNGHTISNITVLNNNLSLDGGVFAIVSGKINNLNFTNIQLETEYLRVGIVAGSNYGTLTNLKVNGNIVNSYNGNVFAGGVAGVNTGLISNVYFNVDVNSSNNDFDINNDSISGGLTGSNSGTIRNVAGIGTIISNKNWRPIAGGITGVNHQLIEAAIFNGTVFTDTGTNTYGRSGGISGLNYGTIKSSVSSGEITANTFRNIAGGITAENFGVVENCLSFADVYVEHNSMADKGYEYAGSIVGKGTDAIDSFGYIDQIIFGKRGNFNKTISLGDTGKIDDFLNLTLLDAEIWTMIESNELSFMNETVWSLPLSYRNESILNPIEIYSVADFYNMNNGLNNHYKLINDIDFTGYISSVIGNNNWDTQPFRGSFDMNGYELLNIEYGSVDDIFSNHKGRVFDSVIPLINLIGDSMVEINIGTVYVDNGATCSAKNDLVCILVTSGDVVDTNTIGMYTIIYNAIDSEGNEAVEVKRYIYVQLEIY